ncbi:prenylcysteine oxidase-like [Copidosoma floridanum]|uniref:prenylcysteine oxidase-like n=1 Tax=Copidosoma floridanum TaxID=29053 RepID=UPI0006C9C96C|nr:prenylcysteine oxidase-like [Copidosoma floridanum]XP_014219401.1 prenylcysteine oxidase-like [Copidosoma floridanum]
MFKHLIIFLIGISNIKCIFGSITCKPKVAVIGAGIGGASASQFITELFNKNVEIDVFEAKKIGGRLANIEFGSNEYEAGGAIIHPRNKYMVDFVNQLGLEHTPPSFERFGIWNGDELVFEESSWESITLVKLLYKYGMQPIHLYRYVDKILDDFQRIYEHQDKGVGFENVTALIMSMNKEFAQLLETPMHDHLTSLGYGEELINQLVKATIVVNYGQDVNIHAFVGCVSVAGAGFDLWSIKGGNKKVPQFLLSRNEKVTVISSTVKKIHKHSLENSPKYEIFHRQSEQNETSGIYDIVIIATPMTSDHENPIAFSGFDNPDLHFPGEFQTTIATFVSGKINYSYFELEDELGGIMSCDPDKTKISCIGKISSVNGKQDIDAEVWKVFSRQELQNMDKIFSKINEVKEIKWKAYPRYSSTGRLDKFKLDDFMYHVNAIEWAASAMEMSAIGGRNAAILAYNDYGHKCVPPMSHHQSPNMKTRTPSSEL